MNFKLALIASLCPFNSTKYLAAAVHKTCSGAYHGISPYQDKTAFGICCNFLCVHSVLPTCITEKVLETLELHLERIFLRVMFVVIVYVYLEIDV